MTNNWTLARLTGTNRPAEYVLYYDKTNLPEDYEAEPVLDKNGCTPNGFLASSEANEQGLTVDNFIKQEAIKSGIWAQSDDDASDFFEADLSKADLEGVTIQNA